MVSVVPTDDQLLSPRDIPLERTVGDQSEVADISIGIILIMFNRFHNYVAEQLAAINENDRFKKPAEGASEKTWAKYDNGMYHSPDLSQRRLPYAKVRGTLAYLSSIG